MTCLTKIIISYYLHTVLLEAKDGKIKASKKKRKQSRGDKQTICGHEFKE